MTHFHNSFIKFETRNVLLSPKRLKWPRSTNFD